MQQISEDVWGRTQSWPRSRERECVTTHPHAQGCGVATTTNVGQRPEVRPLVEDLENVSNAVLKVDF